ncbi:hypothetical protein HHK36_017475 [Tetracentron sinense]|uniref:Bifunctional inhibitor/plant lipid transfer protein/seed storage helical domain-containing protein n=1 Tax=Tetracentron sinense TaxID=13715 RepID=A0A834Z2U8_TETSI|nr:hypothetical protein HHK36_017475 [Tetracentron sinense]
MGGSHCVTVEVSYILVLMMVGLVSSDPAKDRQECASQLVGLAGCLSYVSGQAKAPPPDCCTGLKQVLEKSKKCLCILIRDRNDPSLSSLKINVTIAVGLPGACHSAANVSDCPALLQLPPNSPDAQIFEQISNSTKGSTSPQVATAKGNSSTTTQGKSDGGRGKRWIRVEMIGGVSLWCLTSLWVIGV